MKEEYDYFECTKDEARDLLLHRYVAGAAPSKYCALNSSNSGEMLPLDVALPRNCSHWYEVLPEDILSNMAESFRMGHFLCMVFHWDFVVKKGVNVDNLKGKILDILDKNHAKYPAEHNVGHLYNAEDTLKNFYQQLDPTNSFNSGIGKTSKRKQSNFF